MKIPLFVLLALLVTTGSTNGVSRRPTLASKQLCIVQSNPSNGSCCVSIAGRLIFATKWARVKRSRRGEVSVSPNTDGLSSPPPSMSNTTITSRNGAETQPPPNKPSWLPTFEEIVTSVYRVVLWPIIDPNSLLLVDIPILRPPPL